MQVDWNGIEKDFKAKVEAANLSKDDASLVNLHDYAILVEANARVSGSGEAFGVPPLSFLCARKQALAVPLERWAPQIEAQLRPALDKRSNLEAIKKQLWTTRDAAHEKAATLRAAGEALRHQPAGLRRAITWKPWSSSIGSVQHEVSLGKENAGTPKATSNSPSSSQARSPLSEAGSPPQTVFSAPSAVCKAVEGTEAGSPIGCKRKDKTVTGRADQHSEATDDSVVDSLVAALKAGGVQGQVYATHALAHLAADRVSRASIASADIVPPLLAIMSTDIGAAYAAAELMERLAHLPKFASLVIEQGGVPTMLQLLTEGTRQAFLPTVRVLQVLTGVDSSVAEVIAKTERMPALIDRCMDGGKEMCDATSSLLRGIAAQGHPLAHIGDLSALEVLERGMADDVPPRSSSRADSGQQEAMTDEARKILQTALPLSRETTKDNAVLRAFLVAQNIVSGMEAEDLKSCPPWWPLRRWMPAFPAYRTGQLEDIWAAVKLHLE
jgi:hypothetical protein